MARGLQPRSGSNRSALVISGFMSGTQNSLTGSKNITPIIKQRMTLMTFCIQKVNQTKVELREPQVIVNRINTLYNLCKVLTEIMVEQKSNFIT